VVKKIRNDSGRLLGVQTRALFAHKKDLRRRIAALDIGEEINRSHLERLNSTMRGQQACLIRRTRSIAQGLAELPSSERYQALALHSVQTPG
jgi:hypothetical protein